MYGTTPLYNGNISETIWKTSSDNIHRGYGYEYDKLNRLTDAYFGTNHQINNHFNEQLSYDKNGNITTLQRTGNVDGFDQIIDDLTYEYIGNQLKSVTDADHGNQYFGFVDGNQQGEDYQYDMFGNMIQDLNKGIEEIKYNHLNLPTNIIFANGGVISYLYDAMGVKVRKYVHQQGANNSWTDYLNRFQYSNEILQFFPHAEGYVQYYQEGEENGNTNQGNDGAPLQEGFSYVYQYKDHLGNNRINYTLNKEGTLSILSEDHYYPFGMKHPYNNEKRAWGFFEIDEIKVPFVKMVPNSGYQYKYNGKEWQDELGLDMYDFGFRNYEPSIGRWMNIDKLSEKYYPISPYVYALNNPMFFIDPDGNEIWVYFEDGGSERKKKYEYEKGRDYSEMKGFEKDIYQALDALYEASNVVLDDGTEVNILQTLISSDKILSIVETSNNRGSNFAGNRKYEGNGKWKRDNENKTIGTIHFNKQQGVMYDDTNDTNIQTLQENLSNNQFLSTVRINSPTSYLGHELTHAFNQLTDPTAKRNREQNNNNNKGLIVYGMWFSNMEEAHTTTLSSQINIQLGENPRCNYRGIGVNTKGVLSNQLK